MKGDILKVGEHSPSKKILIATGLYPPDIGGPATYSKQLFDHLPLHGVSVYIVNFGKVRNLPKILRHFIYFLMLLKKGRNTDVIFAQDPVSVGLPAYLASRILRKKFVLKVVGDYAWEQYCQKSSITGLQLPSLEKFQEEKYDLITEMRRRIQKYVAQHAFKVIVPSNYLKKILLGWSVAESKIFVVYNSFSPSSVLEDKNEIRREYGINGNIIVSIGRLVPWKGFGSLIEIMPDILKDYPDAKLLIIGDGSEKKNLNNKILNLSLENEVIMTGRLPHEELRAYLKASDIFILNTAYEGFSHQLLEAMAGGIPVVATDIGGNPELIQDGKDGLLVEYNNKEEIKWVILELLRNEKLRNTLIQNAKEKIREFSGEIMINETIKILI